MTTPQSIDASIILTAPIVGNIGIGSSWERRMQTLAMFSCSLYFILPMVLSCWFATMLMLLWSRTTAACVLCYLGYVFVLDKSPVNGSRSPWLRRMKRWWAHSCDFLPLLLVKTAHLDPSGKYILGYHPHGIIGVGCFGAFATDSAKTLSLVQKSDKRNGDDDRGFSSLFPGIDRRVITLPQNFNTPFLREYFLSMGACTSDKETFRSILKKDGGRAVIVVVGGAAESMHARSGTYDLLLNNRRGFVREAIISNASLVPTIGFGETDLYETYDQDEASWIGSFQKLVKRSTGMAVPVFKGRSIFLRDIGIMPKRRPVVVVVGAPIAPPKLNVERRSRFNPLIDRETDSPLNEDAELVFQWHEKYIKELEDLYSEHKDQRWNLPGKSRRSSMQIK